MSKQEIIQNISGILIELFDSLIVIDIPTDASFLSYSDCGKPFGLDRNGYINIYARLFNYIINLKGIGDAWSEDGVTEIINNVLREFANKKINGGNIDNIKEANSIFDKVAIKFENQLCLIPVIGLSIDTQMEIGDVTIRNIENSRELVSGKTFSFFDNLSSHKDSIATCYVQAEWRKATEFAREKSEYVLNILRFIGSLVWYNQPTRHIYIKGRDRSRFSYSLVINSKGFASRAVNSEFIVLPYKIDAEFLESAKFYGFDYYKKLINNSNISLIEKALTTAIQWYGDATQDLLPLNSFIKYYISIETVLKNENESGKSVVPRRLSVLLSPFDKAKQRKLEKDIEGLIDERNSIFHSGVPIIEKPDYLDWIGKILGRSVIHQVRLRIASEKLQTKDDLIDWIKIHYSKYLK